MSSLFSSAELDQLKGGDVAYVYFLQLDFPAEDGGPLFLHDGIGEIEIAGQIWQGISDPIGDEEVGERLVAVSELPNPLFGSALQWQVVMTGSTKEWRKRIYERARNWRGREANLFFRIYNPETAEPITTSLIPMFFGGRMSHWNLRSNGPVERIIGLTVESSIVALNYPNDERFTNAAQNKRSPGDRIFSNEGEITRSVFG